MAKYFFDSSALAKRYVPERGTNFVDSIFAGDHELFYLNLAVLEVSKVFYRLRDYPQSIEKDSQITDEIFRQMRSKFGADLLRMQKVALTESMIAYAETILEHWYLKSAFDLAHLSAFLISRQEYPGMIFVSADNPLVTAARKFVLESEAINPENF